MYRLHANGYLAVAIMLLLTSNPEQPRRGLDDRVPLLIRDRPRSPCNSVDNHVDLSRGGGQRVHMGRHSRHVERYRVPRKAAFTPAAVSRPKVLSSQLATPVRQQVAQREDLGDLAGVRLNSEQRPERSVSVLRVWRSLPDNGLADFEVGNFVEGLLEVDLVKRDRIPEHKIQQQPLVLARPQSGCRCLELVYLLGAILPRWGSAGLFPEPVEPGTRESQAEAEERDEFALAESPLVIGA